MIQKNSPESRRLLVALVGVPRFFDSVLPSLVIKLAQAGANVLGRFWRYRGEHIPQTNPMTFKVPASNEDWKTIGKLAFSSFETAEPLGDIQVMFDPRKHVQVSQLGLTPNPTASFSWLMALKLGADALSEVDSEYEFDFWMLCRPDLKISGFALKRLLSKLRSDPSFTTTSIATASRARAHRVLFTGENLLNLPIDHFFIGRPEAISKFSDLDQLLNKIRLGEDTSQPLVNEFVLGGFLSSRGLHEYPIRFPYIIWRGDWISSFKGHGRKGPGQFLTIVKAVNWAAVSFLRPGLHKKGL